MTSVPLSPAATEPVASARTAPAGALAGRALRGALQLVVMLLGVLTVLFFVLRATGDPALTIAGENASEEQLAAIRDRYGFDEPILTQYATFLGDAARLDFGESYRSSAPALDAVLERLPETLKLAGLAFAANVALGAVVGVYLGSKPDAISRHMGRGVVALFQGIPPYVMGLALIQILTVELGWLPSTGVASWKSWVMPTVTLAAFMAPRVIQVVASNLAESMTDDYVRTARAMGITRRAILLRHALPNSAIGAVALVGSQLSYLVSGAVIIEYIFTIPGLGHLLVHSVQNLDYAVVQASVFVIAVLVYLTNTATDAALTLIDPRLRKGGRG